MHSLPKPTFEGHKIGGWTSETRFYWAKKKALKHNGLCRSLAR